MADVSLGTGWPRFVPQTRAAGVEDGLTARLADPLWLLARQWQLGEFRGTDGGSPVALRFQADAHTPTWWRPGPAASTTAWQSWSMQSGPLEVTIEAEPDDGSAALRARIDGGVAARRALLAAGLATAASRLHRAAGWPGDTAPSNPADVTLIACVPDPVALDPMIQPWADNGAPAPQTLLDQLGVDAAGAVAFSDAMRAWHQQWQHTATVPGPAAGSLNPLAWDPQRLEYSGGLYFASAREVTLRIDRHPGGPLDWHSADLGAAAPADTATAPAASVDATQSQALTRWSVPQPARFAGMPAARFWEFEDAEVDFGSIDASPADLARLLLVEYTTVYDHNWYLAPLWVPTGALVSAAVTAPVTVVDSFGATVDLQAFTDKPDHHTRMFTLSAPADGTAPPQSSRWFWFAPRLAATLDGDAIETVEVRRDEMANLAWAILRRRGDGFGRTLTVPSHSDTDTPAPPPADVPRYTVESTLPDNWYPLMPVPVDNSNLGAYWLALRPQEGSRPPAGDLLAGTDWKIHEEELGRAGLTLTRTRTLARWHDGDMYTWTGRAAWAGGGEAVSGLTWDYLQ
jgi:hypothetical protein